MPSMPGREDCATEQAPPTSPNAGAYGDAPPVGSKQRPHARPDERAGDEAGERESADDEPRR